VEGDEASGRSAVVLSHFATLTWMPIEVTKAQEYGRRQEAAAGGGNRDKRRKSLRTVFGLGRTVGGGRVGDCGRHWPDLAPRDGGRRPLHFHWTVAARPAHTAFRSARLVFVVKCRWHNLYE
jgi:hypothetical protein